MQASQGSLMYYPAANHVHYLDAQRILELHRVHCLMEKRRNVYSFDQYEPIRRLAMVEHVPRNPEKPLTSFKIEDILEERNEGAKDTGNVTSRQTKKDVKENGVSNDYDDSDFSEGSSECSVWNHNHAENQIEHVQCRNKIIRPWSTSPSLDISDDANGSKCRAISNDFEKYPRGSNPLRLNSSAGSDDEEIDVEGCENENDDDDEFKKKSCKRALVNADISPLDALVAMSSKTFLGIESLENQRLRDQDKHKSQSPRKKRKTRTAFTNQQIYELERRFIMQKYLTPADRDEIAGRLGLTCAQVITWFQNRRAKFKRDIEELKNDVVATSPKECDKNKHIND